jgi:iron complex outermembrane receptor protein
MLFCTDNLLAQIKDTTLTEFNIKGRQKVSGDVRINDFAPGQKIMTIDSATLQQYQLQSLANLLTQQVPVFVKSYGFNGLATLNFRGSSAAQSQVLWNGVPIQNAALGIADVSALPVVFMSKVNVVYGSSGALLGSGNVGGALMLESARPEFDTQLHTLSLSAGAGSFGQYQGALTGSIANRRWYFSATVFSQTALNNFAYTNSLNEKVNMPNDHLQSTAATAQAAYKISDRNVIDFYAWYQQYNREIPPALFETYSAKKENDGSLRLLADWNKQSGSNTWYAKSSFIRDNEQYNDDAVLLHTSNTANQYYQELGWKKQFYKYGQLLIFSPIQISWINLPDSTEHKQQNKIALAAAYDYKLFHNRLDIAANGRAEVINNQSILLPGADASFAITDWLSLRINAQRTYRVPTLNELYYDPGGNPDLKPEQGWNEDAGYTLKLRSGNFTFYQDASLFNRNIHDWIIWLGGAIWTPHNIAEVHSRGAETENNLEYKTGKWKFHLGLNTMYVLATTVTSYIYNDGSIGKQIPYTPRYNGQLNVGFTYRILSVNYNHTYTGYRFITTDESAYLPPYQTGNLQLMYHTAISGHTLQVYGQCNNIWNNQYQVVAGRPMPGTNWQAGFKMMILK